jgi:hypothetical protein
VIGGIHPVERRKQINLCWHRTHVPRDRSTDAESIQIIVSVAAAETSVARIVDVGRRASESRVGLAKFERLLVQRSMKQLYEEGLQ